MRGVGPDGPGGVPIGRIGAVAELEGALLHGRGAALGGPLGVGKTTLARWAVATLEARGRPVVWLQGTPGTRDLPLGSAAPFLAGHEGADGPHDLAERLVRTLAGSAAVCVLDDLHWIDDRTIGVVQQLTATADDIALLATVRDGERVSPAGIGLLRQTAIPDIRVEPLDADDTEQLVTHLLGGPPDRTLLRAVVSVAGGNPLFVTELLATARARGALSREHDLWRLTGALTPSTILGEVVAVRFDGLGPDELRAAELLAVAEGLDPDAAEAACGAEALAELDRAGLLGERATLDGILVDLLHPLHGEVLRGKLGRLTLRAHRRALAEAVQAAAGPEGLRDVDALRVARWRLDAGDPVPADLALRAAAAAHRTYDLPGAERLARIAWDATPSVASGNLLAEVLHGRTRFDEALQVVGRVRSLAEGDRDRATTIALDAVARFHGERDVDGALALVREGLVPLGDPAARRALRVAEIYLLLMAERFDGLDAAIAGLETECPAHATPAMRQLVVGAHIIRGRMEEALALVATPVLDEEDLFVRSEDLGAMADGLRALALTRGGRVLEAETIALGTHPRCLELGAPRARAAAAYTLAMALLLQGRPEDAGRWAADAVVAQEGILAPNGLLMAHALGLEAALDQGDRARAERERAALADLADTHERLYAAIGWRAEATARAVLDDDLPGAIDLLCERATAYLALGAVEYASDLAHRAVVLGADPAAVLDVAEAAATGSMPLAGLRARHLRALTAGDADELEAVGDTLAAMGCRVDARRVLADAATAAARGGATRRATELRHRAEALALAATPAPTPTSSPGPAAAPAPLATPTEPGPAPDRAAGPDARPDGGDPSAADGGGGGSRGPTDRPRIDPARWSLLSPREAEVTRLAAQGLASKAIAAELHLSARTVDHALQRAYAKLGIAGRADLVGRLLPAAPTP